MLDELKRLGLNNNEAKIYHALILKGKATASDLIKYLGVHRNIVYDNLEKLKEKGLVSFIVEESKRLYQAQEPESIIELLNKEKKSVEDKLSLANKIIPDIKSSLGSDYGRSEAQIFHGIKGVKKVLANICSGKYAECYIIGISNESVNVLGTTFWNNFNKKVQHVCMKEYILMNYEYKETTNLTENDYAIIRILPKEVSQKVEVLIYGNNAAIFVYKENPSVLVIQDKDIVGMYKSQFDFYWKKAKKLVKK